MQLTFRRMVLGMTAVGGLVIGTSAWAGGDDKKGGAEHEFSKMDTNGDGKVSADEHAAGAKKMFEMMDANKDGKVTADEMTAAHEQVAGAKAHKTDMTAADKIKMIDTNNDGTVSADEHAEGSKKMFERMDTNKDGFLTKAELSAGHSKMMHKDKGSTDTTDKAPAK
jgi:Ca2+-binding EF-hand superfamily protein